MLDSVQIHLKNNKLLTEVEHILPEHSVHSVFAQLYCDYLPH